MSAPLTHLDWAQFYDAQGFELIDMPAGSKRPTKKDWQNTSTPPAYWQDHPQANMGVELGRSGLASLDLDDLEAARAVFTDIGIDLDALIAKAPRIIGNPGRMRVLFRATDPELRKVALAWPESENPRAKRTIFELRGGHGFQDVLPPSRHPDGYTYQWAPGLALGEVAIPPLPPILTDLWRHWRTWEPSLVAICPHAKRQPLPKARLGDVGLRQGNGDVIGAWNDAHPIDAVLESHGYERKGRDRWLAPGSTSGLPGVHLLDNGRVFSHHGSDALSDGNPHDSFDVFRLLEHGGDFTAAIRDAAQRLGLRRSPPNPPMPSANDEQKGKDERTDGPEEPEVREINLSRLAAYRPKAPDYLIYPLIPRRHLTLLGGHGEAGKSQLGLILAAHVACGKPWAGLEVRQARVAVISMEDDEEDFMHRLKKIADGYALDYDALAANLRMIDGSDAGPLAFESNEYGTKALAFTRYAERIAKIAQETDLLVIDNVSDAYAADPNNALLVRTFLKRLVSWVRGHRGAVLLLAHINKAGAQYGTSGNSYLGSVAWHNTPRSRLALEKDARLKDAVTLKHEKLNVGKKLSEPLNLQWGPDSVLVPVSHEVSAAVVKFAESTQDEEVFSAIKAAITAGITIPTAVTGAHTAWHQLIPFPELPANLKTARGKKTVDAAMIRLQRAGRIRLETIKVNYKPRDRWVLADDATQDEDA